LLQLFLFRLMSRKKNYFNEEVDKAIIEYNNSTDYRRRSYLYENYIMKAVSKIAENLIHRHKIFHSENDNIKDTIHDVNCHVVEKIHRINPELGKPFSYLTRTILNYLIFHSGKAYNRMVGKAFLDEVDNVDVSKTKYVLNTYVSEEHSIDHFTPKFIYTMRNELNSHFVGTRDVVTANAILNVIEMRYSIEIFDKRSILVYVRNIIKISPQRFSRILRKIKNLYKSMKEEYESQFEELIKEKY